MIFEGKVAKGSNVESVAVGAVDVSEIIEIRDFVERLESVKVGLVHAAGSGTLHLKPLGH
jgi:hypothetical protein